MIDRKLGRPHKYGYDQILSGQSMELNFDLRSDCEKAQRSALSYARRMHRKFQTIRLDKKLIICRIE